MIIMRIHQGLGNQLFQYACGRSLSLDRGVPLYLEESFFYHPNASRQFYLNNFPITGKRHPPIARQHGNKIGYSVMIPADAVRYTQRRSGFQSDIYDLPKQTILLNGFFQSEKYFEHNADIIRKDLSFSNLQHDETSHKVQAMICRENAVSLHIRRTDYVGNKRYDILSMQYYERAKEHIYGAVDNPTFFIFSDDVEFCQQHMTTPDSIIVPCSKNPVADLFLMSQCQHHIIANSSFSWWGAWLCANPDKIVIAPSQWFHPDNEPLIDDIVPARWVRVDI